MNITWAQSLLVPLVSAAFVSMVVAVLWMNRGRFRGRVKRNEPSLTQEQEAISQEPIAPVAQGLGDLPPRGPEAPADVEPVTPEVEMEKLETPKQEEGAQEEGAEPADSLLAIFQEETVPDGEALSLIEGVESIDIEDLLRNPGTLPGGSAAKSRANIATDPRAIWKPRRSDGEDNPLHESFETPWNNTTNVGVGIVGETSFWAV